MDMRSLATHSWNSINDGNYVILISSDGTTGTRVSFRLVGPIAGERERKRRMANGMKYMYTISMYLGLYRFVAKYSKKRKIHKSQNSGIQQQQLERICEHTIRYTHRHIHTQRVILFLSFSFQVGFCFIIRYVPKKTHVNTLACTHSLTLTHLNKVVHETRSNRFRVNWQQIHATVTDTGRCS